MADKPRVVIVGAGFAGLTAQHRLAKSGMAVTLVDRNVYGTFQPLLYQVATAGLASSDVAYPAWTAAHKTRTEFRKGEVVGIDTGTRQVQLADGGVLGYEYLSTRDRRERGVLRSHRRGRAHFQPVHQG